MAVRSLGLPFFAPLCAFLLSATSLSFTQATSGIETPDKNPPPPSATITRQIGPTAPTLSEMRAMTAEQLDIEGDLLRGAKDYLSALDCYREAVHKHATAEYYNKIAITNLLLRRAVDAEKAAKHAVRKDKHLAEAWNNLAVTYYTLNKYEDAIRTYQRAISLKPASASFHSNLAAAFMDSKQFERGLAEYRKAFALDPTFFEHTSQNGVSAHMGSPQDRAQYSFFMAKLFAASGDIDRALHFLRSAMEDGYPKVDDVYRDKEFAGIRNDQRFAELMKDRPVSIQ